MASSPTRADVLALAFASQAFVPEAEQRRPSAFLSLAPTTSASYPSNPVLKASSPMAQSPAELPVAPITAQVVQVSADAETLPVIPRADAIDMGLKTRRSSSLSSEGSNGSAQKKRFLKLGPVHHGESYGTGDWSEEVVAE